MFAVQATDAFLRRARKFLSRHPELEARLGEVIDQLRMDPFVPRLGLHSLKGKLEGVFAVRLDRRYRLTITLDVEARLVTLLDIGGHNEVSR